MCCHPDYPTYSNSDNMSDRHPNYREAYFQHPVLTKISGDPTYTSLATATTTTTHADATTMATRDATTDTKEMDAVVDTAKEMNAPEQMQCHYRHYRANTAGPTATVPTPAPNATTEMQVTSPVPPMATSKAAAPSTATVPIADGGGQ